MSRTILILSVFTLLALPLATGADEELEIPEYTVEGLKLVPNPEDLSYVWAKPGAELSQYKRVYLTEPYVAFRKNWKRDHNRGTDRVSTNDMERIRADVGELFMEIFKEELEKGGYLLADERAEDVLIVKPAIINLDAEAPDTRSAARSRTYGRHAGEMTLYLELYDSVTGDLLAKAVDRRIDRESWDMELQDRLSNRRAAKAMMEPWAEALRKGLDRAHKETGEAKQE
jgi:hypothetical protein